ncbi:MAG: hypothetical protein LBB26_03465 [Puniceicoccales bacterium]|jgi:hypothetical protein|nr:hypothetical protein [Puniceicoccales bacterium]
MKKATDFTSTPLAVDPLVSAGQALHRKIISSTPSLAHTPYFAGRMLIPVRWENPIKST